MSRRRFEKEYATTVKCVEIRLEFTWTTYKAKYFCGKDSCFDAGLQLLEKKAKRWQQQKERFEKGATNLRSISARCSLFSFIHKRDFISASSLDRIYVSISSSSIPAEI